MAKSRVKRKATVRGNYQTLQTIYDKVTRRLLKQNAVSKTHEEDICRLRDPEGNVCAIGALVPKAKYSADLEDMVPLTSVNCKLARIAGIRTERQRNLAEALREIHDGTSPQYWAGNFRDVAQRFNLNPVKV